MAEIGTCWAGGSWASDTWGVGTWATSLGTPGTLAVTVDGDGYVQLTWTDNADGETGYKVYRRDATAGEDYSLLASIAADSESHEDQGAFVAGHSYGYYVIAYNGGESGKSNKVSILPNPSGAAGGSRRRWVASR